MWNHCESLLGWRWDQPLHRGCINHREIQQTQRPHTWQYSDAAAATVHSACHPHVQLAPVTERLQITQMNENKRMRIIMQYSIQGILKIKFSCQRVPWRRGGATHAEILIFLLRIKKGRSGSKLHICDHLPLWEWVQWRIVPTANPWPANYSSDPLGVCVPMGGRQQWMEQGRAHWATV